MPVRLSDLPREKFVKSLYLIRNNVLDISQMKLGSFVVLRGLTESVDVKQPRRTLIGASVAFVFQQCNFFSKQIR